MLCWYCGSMQMQGLEYIEKGTEIAFQHTPKGWCKCTNCGATYIEMPKLKGRKIAKAK